ncbi:hypothetical protein KUTeg_023999 [Tegillarca granosa]|uniref:CD109 n=1 Tax=Tegillarca granosa TaxID=220873 RepID=A0ABQ9DW32_TEGGR|nr:hypothetical protein KUTeg_023999 [Tegillarca granosa]
MEIAIVLYLLNNMWRLLVLSVVLTAVLAKDSYVVVVPKNVRPGVPYNISINILKATSDVQVTADLIHKSSSQKVSSAQKTFTQDLDRNSAFCKIPRSPDTLAVQVPDAIPSGTYKIAVHGTNGLTFSNETDLHFEHKSVSIFVQTDKAMYKPGQTGVYYYYYYYYYYLAKLIKPCTNQIKQMMMMMKMMMMLLLLLTFAIHPNLTVYTGAYDISIYDPNTNKIKQWLGVRDISGVITNFMLMDTQPVLGDWKIKVTAHDQSTEKVFTVAHYVLPKFELPTGLRSDGDIQGTIKAKYTYGKPVKGTVTIRAKDEYYYRPWNYHGDQPMVEQTINLILNPVHSRLNTIVVEANVTETLTHITLSGSSKIKYYDHAEKVESKLHSRMTDQLLGARKSLTVKTTVTYELPTPTPTPLYFYGPQTRQYHIPDHTFTVPDTGIVPVQVDIPENATNINLNVQYGTIHAYKSLSKSYSPSESYVQVLLKSSRLTAGSMANFDVKSTQSVGELVYQVMSRGSIVAAGTVNGHNAKTFTFGIPVDASMAPNARIITYYVRTDGEIVTDSISFDVEGVFDNKVSIHFDKTKAQPGENVNVEVTADPQSLVNLLAVDQSVLLLKSGNDITPEEVVSELKSYDTISHTSLFGGGPVFFGGGAIAARKKRMIWWPYPIYYECWSQDTDIYFAKGGGIQPAFAMAGATGGMINSVTGSGGQSGPLKEPAKIRSKFPETWLWSNHSVGVAGGSTGVSLKEVTKIRTEFPETWLWVNSTTGHGGFLMGGIGGFQAVNSVAHLAGSDGCPMCETAFGGAGGGFAFNGPQPIPNGPTGLAGSVTSPLKEVTKIRSNFPETWLWTNVTTRIMFPFYSADGRVQISTTVPDTITSWVASAFAVHSQSGLGVAPTTAKIEAFRPFFVSLNLPYSVVRGEQVVLQANVFNYMTQDMDVLVTLSKNDDFRNVIINADGTSQYEKQSPVFFPIVPAGLGKIDITVKAQSTAAADAVKRQLLVEPEGVPKEYNTPILVDLKQSSSFSKTVPISLSAGVVAGSQRVRVSAIGDLMGPTVNGLDKLLRMPTGCGEQTMLGMAPDIFVTNYLKATNQLTGDIEEKALEYMDKGYQRELTFQHKDGSFSAFGDRDKSGSMLSAFVVKSFHQARQHIFVDDDVIKRAIDWMISRQNGDGSFPEPGRVIHKDMQGIQQRTQSAMTKATTYLESQISSLTDDYALAISSYALSLAKSSQAPAVFTKLDNDAIVKDGMKHWHKPESAKTTGHHYWRAPHQQSKPMDIEMTSYALLVYAHENQFTSGLPVMKWITTQRNPSGGFVSTQLPSVPSNVQISATGHGMGLVEVSVFFNVEQEIEEPSFELNVTMVKETLDLIEVKTCTRWTKPGASGMTVQEFGVPTGFEADVESIGQLDIIKKIETENRKVILYFDEITTVPVCITMEAIRTGLVAKSQPAPIRIYDYYEPSITKKRAIFSKFSCPGRMCIKILTFAFVFLCINYSKMIYTVRNILHKITNGSINCERQI